MAENKITIGFTLEDEFDNKYTQTSSLEIFPDLGETEVDVIGEQLNIFLKQCGYVRNNDNILMEDLTDDEYDALLDYLDELRKRKDCDNR